MPNRPLLPCFDAIVAVAIVATTFPAAAAPMFMGLGDLPGGSFHSWANAVSADGSAVTGYSDSGTNPGGGAQHQAFRWTAADGMVGLGDLPGGPFHSVGLDISADGSVITGYSHDASTPLGGGLAQAFRWTASGGMQGLGRLAGTSTSHGQGISADGSIIVGDGGGAFRWTESGGMVNLGNPPDPLFFSSASAVSADGLVAVGRGSTSDHFYTEALRWTADGAEGLGDLPGGSFYSQAWAVSADGSVVVGTGTTGVTGDGVAFRWTAGTGMVSLGTLPGSFKNPPISAALAVSADGSVVVGSASSPSSNEAFIWDEVNGMRELDQVLAQLGVDIGDWTLTGATGISADGLTIVGYGSHPFGGVREAWIAVIPEPNTGLLVLTGLLGLAYRQRRHGREGDALARCDGAHARTARDDSSTALPYRDAPP